MTALVIGVGNAERGDDAAGLAVAARLQQTPPPGVRVLTLSGEPSALIDAWQETEHVVIVDSASGRGPAGRVHRFDATAARLPAALLRSSTHSLGVAEAIELGRALQRLPPRVTVYCIEADSFDLGEGLSPGVASAVEAVVEELLEELR